MNDTMIPPGKVREADVGFNGLSILIGSPLRQGPEDKDRLREHIVKFVSRWVRAECQITRTIRRENSSYTWKHIAERELGVYVSNGEFILAALRAGVGAIPTAPRSLNAFFNLKRRAVGTEELADLKSLKWVTTLSAEDLNFRLTACSVPEAARKVFKVLRDDRAREIEVSARELSAVVDSIGDAWNYVDRVGAAMTRLRAALAVGQTFTREQARGYLLANGWSPTHVGRVNAVLGDWVSEEAFERVGVTGHKTIVFVPATGNVQYDTWLATVARAEGRTSGDVLAAVAAFS